MRSWVSNWLDSRSPLETHSACHWFHRNAWLVCLSPLVFRHVLILLEQAGKQRGCWQCGWSRMPTTRASPRRGRGSANKQKRCRANKQKRWSSQRRQRRLVERADHQRRHINQPLYDASDKQRWSVTFYSDHMPPMSLLLTFTLFSVSDCLFVVFSRRSKRRNKLLMSKKWHEPVWTDQSKGDV